MALPVPELGSVSSAGHLLRWIAALLPALFNRLILHVGSACVAYWALQRMGKRLDSKVVLQEELSGPMNETAATVMVVDCTEVWAPKAAPRL